MKNAFVYFKRGTGVIESINGTRQSLPCARNRFVITMVLVFGVERELDVPLDKFPNPEELEKIEREALISNCEHGWYDSAHDSVKLHYRYFLPSNKKPQAVLVFQHGICVHGGNAWCLKSSGRKLNMSLLSEACLKEDIAVYAPDMYGQGYSEGTRFLIPSWETNFKDLLAFIDLVSKKHKGVPLLFKHHALPP